VTDLKGKEPEFVKIPLTTGIYMVFVRTLTGKIFEVNTSSFETVENLKSKI
jgi:hypothetical protein